MKKAEEQAPQTHYELGPAASYTHSHRVPNVNVQYEQRLTFGQRISDRLTMVIGGWPFVITQSFFLAAWMAVNVYLAVMIKLHPGYLKAWDPYPFILLNLVLSFQAAYTGPIVMMSQNRQADRDRLMAQQDFEVNRTAEEEIEVIMKHLAHQDKMILGAINRLDALKAASPDASAEKLDALVRRLEEAEQRIADLVSNASSTGGNS